MVSLGFRSDVLSLMPWVAPYSRQFPVSFSRASAIVLFHVPLVTLAAAQGHPVGRLATEVTQDTAQLMEAVQYHCHGASFHGVIEGLLLRMWEETGTEVPVDFSEVWRSAQL